MTSCMTRRRSGLGQPSISLLSCRLTGLAIAPVLLGATPVAAFAHVKWFTATNVHDAPQPLSVVLSTTFLIVLIVASLLVLLGFLLDGWVALHWPRILTSGLTYGGLEERLVRAAAGAYYVVVSATGGVILTPELKSHASWLGVVQFAIALLLVWRPTCLIAGVGILVLYLDAVVQYGIFHLMDYVFVPCLAFYLASLSLHSPRLRRMREPLLVSGLAFSLAWTAIEKFLYPQWTAAVIATHPSIGMGVATPLVVVIAGFIEFTLAFYLVTGRGLLRLGGLGYASIFIAAMPAFGKLDVFGHLVIIAILSIVALRGTTPLQSRLHLDGSRIAADGVWILLLYLLSLVVFFAMYYALQRA